MEKTKLIALLAFTWIPFLLYADTHNEYELAKKAIATGDCPSAIKYLEAFKRKNKDELKLDKHQDFLKSIDQQIDLCKPNTIKIKGSF